MPIRYVISDFGGVLTSPLSGAFRPLYEEAGIGLEQLGIALMSAGEQLGGKNPLFELECGRISEPHFVDLLRDGLEPLVGERPKLERFSESFFGALDPNDEIIALMAELSATHRMAILTNNVKEWEPLWRAMVPVDEIFETVVDSAFVGMRKPDPEIYHLTLERLGGPEPGECLFVDDMELNCEAARDLGLVVVQHEENEKTIAEIRELLDV